MREEKPTETSQSAMALQNEERVGCLSVLSA